MADFDEQVESLQSMLKYGNMIEWANCPKEIDMFDSVMDAGNASAIYFAVQALGSTWAEATGYRR